MLTLLEVVRQRTEERENMGEVPFRVEKVLVTLPERIYDSQYGNGVLAMFTS